MMALSGGTALGALAAIVPNIQAVQVLERGTPTIAADRLLTRGLANPGAVPALLASKECIAGLVQESTRAVYNLVALHSTLEAGCLFDRQLIWPMSGASVAINERSDLQHLLLRDVVIQANSSPQVVRPALTAVRQAAVVELIQAKRLTAYVEPENLPVADAAVRDALILVRRSEFAALPTAMLSDDGILTLQWRRGEYGVALIFGGDQTASIAFRRPNQLYSENGLEMPIEGDFPQKFIDALALIVC